MVQKNTATENAKRILVIDGNFDILMAVGSILRSQGYIVGSASSVEECFQKVVEQTPDVIILDILMSKINEGQVVKFLKSNPKTESIPIIFLTMLEENKIKKAALVELGQEFYLIKPLLADNLIKEVQLTLRSK